MDSVWACRPSTREAFALDHGEVPLKIIQALENPLAPLFAAQTLEARAKAVGMPADDTSPGDRP